MAEEKLLTVRDVSIVLGVSEREIMELAESGRLPAYKVGGVYLRFKREQIDEFRKTFKPSQSSVLHRSKESSAKEKLNDFFYFNDFYILSALIIAVILFFVFQGY